MKYEVNQKDFVYLRKTSVGVLEDNDTIQTKGKLEVYNDDDTLYPKLFISENETTVDVIPANIQNILDKIDYN